MWKKTLYWEYHIQFTKNKRQSLERSQKENNLTYRRSRVSIIAGFSEIMQARGEWNEIFTDDRRKLKLKNKIITLLMRGVTF